jgi:hypothetical protein
VAQRPRRAGGPPHDHPGGLLIDDAGQSALFDAFLFFIIAVVASAAVLGYTSLSLAEDERVARADALAYAEDVRVALMRTTLENPWYVNRTGERVDLGDGVSVERFLVDEAQLLALGLSSEDFSVMDTLILERAKSVVRPPFGVGIEASLSGVQRTAHLWLGDGVAPPADRFTAAWTYGTSDGDEVRLALHLWYA